MLVALALAGDVSNVAAMVWTRWTDEQVKELLTRFKAGEPLTLIVRSVGEAMRRPGRSCGNFSRRVGDPQSLTISVLHQCDAALLGSRGESRPACINPAGALAAGYNAGGYFLPEW